jgi:hypothetical protein
VQRECQLRSAPSQKSPSWRLSRYRGSRDFSQPLHSQPRRLSTLSLVHNDEEDDVDECNRTIRRSVSGLPPRSSSVLEAPVHAIATPKPTLLFAIASDDVNEVRQVLESGEAGPNDQVGPQSALAFTLTNDKLSHKNEIVKALLAYGADPSALRNPELNPSAQVSSKESEDVSGSHSQPGETMPEGMDPATRCAVPFSIFHHCFLTRILDTMLPEPIRHTLDKHLSLYIAHSSDPSQEFDMISLVKTGY